MVFIFIFLSHSYPLTTLGHAFIVEAAVSLGGRSVEAGLNVFRFANRIPLLFETSSDVITKTANDIKWASYKINKDSDKVGVFVSIVSTKIPFKVPAANLSEESIGAGVTGEMRG